jgi:hypothetical protein
MSQAELDLSPAELRRRAQTFLTDVVRREDALFPYITIVRRGEYVHDFDHPSVIRYTINSLLGLQAAARHDPSQLDPAEVAALTTTFLEHHLERIDNPADLGLLLVLLSEGDPTTQRATKLLGRVDAAARSSAPRKWTMQEASWMLWGACAAAQAGIAPGAATARVIAELVLGRFVDPGSGLPRHSLRRYRGDIVSFGALTYFLRAMFEFSRLSGDPRAWRAFERGVEAIVGIQGDRGEWPWLISVRGRRPLDIYPVFAVHQDSMSMLFLLPALESGMNVGEAIAKSFAWVRGRNELSAPMIEHEPFVAYRSIERAEGLPRARRYLRATIGSFAGAASESANGQGVRINRECRSYHLGWIAYVWSGKSDVTTGAVDAALSIRRDDPLAS